MQQLSNPERFTLLVWTAALTTWVWTVVPASLGMYASKRGRIARFLKGMSTEALELYVEQWLPAARHEKDRANFVSAHLADLLQALWPQALIFSVLSLCSVLALATGCSALLAKDESLPLSLPIMAALAGGFCWVLYDQIACCRIGDFTPSDVAGHSLRLVISIPLGASLSSVSAPNVGAAVSFCLAAFPTTTLFKYARRFADRSLSLGDSINAETALEVEHLQGVGRPEAERLAEEGIASLLQLAYSDPVALALRTNVPLDFATDVVSQALLWTYARDRLPRVQSVGVRGAVEASNLRSLLQGGDQAALGVVEALAGALEVSRDCAMYILGEVTGDPYTEFLCALWAESDRIQSVLAATGVSPVPSQPGR